LRIDIALLLLCSLGCCLEHHQALTICLTG
jgi:hypothetical protein